MNRKTRIPLSFAIALVCALIAAPASAQMSLNDCLKYARDHAPQNIINRIENSKADLDRRITLASVLPSLAMSVNGNVSFGRNIDPATNTYDNRKTLYSGFGIGMSLPLFDGLVSINNIRSARMEELRRRHQSRADEDERSLKVIAAFYNVFYCRALVGQMEENLRRDSATLDATAAEVRLGSKSEADIADIRALVATDEYDLTNQRNLLAKAYLRLRAEMGMEPSEEPLDIADDTGSDSAESGPSDFGAAIDLNPRVAGAEAALRQSGYELNAARGRFAPTISLNAGISTSYYSMSGADIVTPSFKSQWHNNMGEYIGVSLSLPIFDGLYNLNRLKKARLNRIEQREILEQTRLQVRQEASEAELDYESAAKEWTAAEARLDAEQKAFRTTQRKYELGGASAVDLYNASARLSLAKATAVGKRIQMIINRITLLYYRGEKLIKD